MPNRPAHLVRLISAPNEMEAGIIVATLEDNGIRATITGQTTSGFRAEAPGWVQVLVAEEDVPRAEALLDKIDQGRDDVDWSQVDVGEPDHEVLPDAGSVPWWISSAFWRRVTAVVIVVGLAWFAAGILRMAITLIGGF
jgi:hypothetical protein